MYDAVSWLIFHMSSFMVSPKDEIHKDLTKIIENNTKEAEEIKVDQFSFV